MTPQAHALLQSPSAVAPGACRALVRSSAVEVDGEVARQSAGNRGGALVRSSAVEVDGEVARQSAAKLDGDFARQARKRAVKMYLDPGFARPTRNLGFKLFRHAKRVASTSGRALRVASTSGRAKRVASTSGRALRVASTSGRALRVASARVAVRMLRAEPVRTR